MLYWLEARGVIIRRGVWRPQTINAVWKTIWSEAPRGYNYRPNVGFVQYVIAFLKKHIGIIWTNEHEFWNAEG